MTNGHGVDSHYLLKIDEIIVANVVPYMSHLSSCNPVINHAFQHAIPIGHHCLGGHELRNGVFDSAKPACLHRWTVADVFGRVRRHYVALIRRHETSKLLVRILYFGSGITCIFDVREIA